MQSLISLIHNYRVAIVFVSLEILSLWLIFSENPYQSNAFFTSANQVVGSLYDTRNDVLQYFSLKEHNLTLQEENVKLKHTLEVINYKQSLSPNINMPDSLIKKQFDFIPAVVIKNSVGNSNNYFLLNKGTADGITVGSGVYNEKGALGIIKAVSDHYSSVYSLLHQNLVVPVIHKKSGNLCSIQWATKNIFSTSLRHLPKHVKAFLGDTIITSGYSNAFPKNINVGVISSIEVKPNELFHLIEVDFFPNFNQLYHVYVSKKNNTEIINHLITEY